MKLRKIITVFLIMLLALSAVACVKEKAPTEAAIVNGEAIAWEDFEQTLSLEKKIFEMRWAQQFGPMDWSTEIEPGVPYLDMFKQDVLDKMIVNLLIFQEAAKNEITLTQEELDEIMAEFKSDFEDTEYQEFLAMYDMTEETFVNYIKTQEIENRFYAFFTESLNTSVDELQTHFDEKKNQFIQVGASHILVYSIEEAQEVLDLIQEGYEFAELAMEYSEDFNSAIMGGDLGYFGKGDMVGEFEEAAFSLQAGEISEIITSDFGFHIIYVYDVKDTFELNEDRVRRDFYSSKYRAHIEKLESEATIQRNL